METVSRIAALEGTFQNSVRSRPLADFLCTSGCVPCNSTRKIQIDRQGARETEQSEPQDS
jgi:hypothetical protein